MLRPFRGFRPLLTARGSQAIAGGGSRRPAGACAVEVQVQLPRERFDGAPFGAGVTTVADLGPSWCTTGHGTSGTPCGQALGKALSGDALVAGEQSGLVSGRVRARLPSAAVCWLRRTAATIFSSIASGISESVMRMAI